MTLAHALYLTFASHLAQIEPYMLPRWEDLPASVSQNYVGPTPPPWLGKSYWENQARHVSAELAQ